MTSMSMDVSQLRAYARAAASVAPEVRDGLRAGMKEAAEVIATAVRAEASWSDRIPASVKAKGKVTSAVVTAGGSGAPEAAPLNHGGAGGFFRHPVFGNRAVWVDQRARPFLEPAFDASADAAARVVLDAIDVNLLEVLG